MNKIRPFFLAATIIASALLAYGLFTLPSAKPADYEGFSSERAIKDIEVISKEHHSVAHAQERASVRDYLVSRLHGLGADTVKLFTYDSLVGPKNKHVEYLFDATDVLAQFAPANVDNCTWLMLVAHYDSRYSQPMPKDTVWSYGAADDGYGVSVILETVSQVLKDRDNWSQGVKVLFTDAEEAGMLGMSSLWENNREEFDNVGLMINIEARGPWGPALLFETCPGNSKIMDLYGSQAKYPYTYSLTTVVYRFMPNFTDFTIVKDSIPGMNFSTIADINHYHTDLDNFSNISGRSIQHYGAQVLPIAREYLTNGTYSDPDSLRSDKDSVNFTVPVFGLFNMSKSVYTTLNIIVFLLFILMFALECARGRAAVLKSLKSAGIIMASAIGVLAVCEGGAWLCSVIAGAKFKAFGVIHGIQFDNAAMIVMSMLLTATAVLIYMSCRRRTARMVTTMRNNAVANALERYTNSVLYGAMALEAVLTVILLFALGENLMFFIPLICALSSMILYRITTLKLCLLLGISFTLLHALSFLYALAMALTIGAYGAVAMIAFLDIMVLVPMSDLYLTRSK